MSSLSTPLAASRRRLGAAAGFLVLCGALLAGAASGAQLAKPLVAPGSVAMTPGLAADLASLPSTAPYGAFVHFDGGADSRPAGAARGPRPRCHRGVPAGRRPLRGGNSRRAPSAHPRARRHVSRGEQAPEVPRRHSRLGDTLARCAGAGVRRALPGRCDQSRQRNGGRRRDRRLRHQQPPPRPDEQSPEQLQDRLHDAGADQHRHGAVLRPAPLRRRRQHRFDRHQRAGTARTSRGSSPATGRPRPAPTRSGRPRRA